MKDLVNYSLDLNIPIQKSDTAEKNYLIILLRLSSTIDP